MGWTNDYHLDINTEQNYWIANVGNLAECHLPLFDYIKDLSIHGAKQQKIYMVVKDGLHILQPIHGDIQLYQVVFFGDYSRLHLLGLPLIYGHNMITHKIKIFKEYRISIIKK